MKEMLRALERFQAAGDPAVLATVVATRGSTYRKPGARMVLAASGAAVGSVSGGCLEGDLLEIARAEVLPSGRARLVVYATGAPEEMVWGLNMGCNGVVEVLLEPVASADPLLAAMVCELDGGRPCCLVTHLSESPPLRRWLVRTDQTVLAAPDSPALPEATRADALALLERRTCASLVYEAGTNKGRPSPPGEQPTDGAVRFFMETVVPAPRLFLFGAGHDAVPLVEAAARAGWAVTVVDHRSVFLTSERFPRAGSLLHARPEYAVAEAGVESADFAVVMTHNFSYDQALLRGLCEAAPRYIGILGPRARTEALLKALGEEGFTPAPDVLKRIASPLGLDIGGEGPDDVALSAVAELQAVRYGRPGGRLRDRQGQLHD